MSDKIKNLMLNRKRRNVSIEREERDSDRERKIAIFRKDSILVIYVKKIYDLFYILENICHIIFIQEKNYILIMTEI